MIEDVSIFAYAVFDGGPVAFDAVFIRGIRREEEDRRPPLRGEAMNLV